MIAAACTCGTTAGTGRPTLTQLLQRGTRLLDTLRPICGGPRAGSPFGRGRLRNFTMLGLPGGDRTGFRARLCSRRSADISVARVEATAPRRADAGLIRFQPRDSHIVMLQISGSTRSSKASDPGRCVRRFDAVQRTSLRSGFPARLLAYGSSCRAACNRLDAISRPRHASSLARARFA